ncbi:MAG: hypothetical protein HC799_03510 [Limnothrix sp. RL_2_0]|nr:hypothetical protein [Limnothrix sp. RL_2_0]
MNVFELLILVIYILIVWYIYQSIVEELNQLTAIKLDQDQLQQNLAQYGLAENLTLKFDFGRSPLTDVLDSFKITIENQTRKQYFAVHWAESSLMDFDGQSQRIIRVPPGLNIDLFPAQANSVIAPRESLSSKLTIENCLKLNDQNRFDLDQPIFTTNVLREARDENFEFELNLMIQCSRRESHEFLPVLYPVTCTFTVVKLPWQKAIYWRSKTPQKSADQAKKDAQKKSRQDRKTKKYAAQNSEKN